MVNDKRIYPFCKLSSVTHRISTPLDKINWILLLSRGAYGVAEPEIPELFRGNSVSRLSEEQRCFLSSAAKQRIRISQKDHEEEGIPHLKGDHGILRTSGSVMAAAQTSHRIPSNPKDPCEVLLARSFVCFSSPLLLFLICSPSFILAGAD